MDITNIKTLGELKSSGYKVDSVKDEIRRNLISKIKEKKPLFEGIIGYENTVIPSIVNSLPVSYTHLWREQLQERR